MLFEILNNSLSHSLWFLTTVFLTVYEKQKLNYMLPIFLDESWKYLNSSCQLPFHHSGSFIYSIVSQSTGFHDGMELMSSSVDIYGSAYLYLYITASVSSCIKEQFLPPRADWIEMELQKMRFPKNWISACSWSLSCHGSCESWHLQAWKH